MVDLRVGSENSLLGIHWISMDSRNSAKKGRVFGFWSRSRRSEGVRSCPLDMLRLSTYTLDFLKKKISMKQKLLFSGRKKIRENF